MSVLLIAEHNNTELRPFTFNAATAASKINEDLHVLVLGNKSESVAKAASEIPLVKNLRKLQNNYLSFQWLKKYLVWKELTMKTLQQKILLQ